MVVKKGDKILVDYEGKLDDGTVFDSSANHEEKLSFEVGTGQVIPGFDNAVMGMEVGQETKVNIDPANAYGELQEELVLKVPRSSFPPEQALELGMVFGVPVPDGNQVPGRLTKFDDTEAVLDLNHPLAGKNLNFTIKLISIG
jgi:peptidylprolyl isomerase